MSEVSAAIGTVQLSHLDSWVGRRREIAEIYHQAFADHPLLDTPKVRPGAKHAWHQYCLATENPDELVSHLDQHGIDARRYYVTPCHQQNVFAIHPQHGQVLPVTATLSGSLVAIPVMHELRDDEIERIIAAVMSFSVLQH